MALFDDEIEISKVTALPGDDTGALEVITDINEIDEEVTDPVIAEVAVAKPASRYAGKTQVELEQMLEDAQAHIGRQSSEIGEVRKLADELVKKSLKVPTVKEVPAVSEEHEDDFFADPKAAVARAVSKHPAVVAAQEATETANREKATARVQAKHPDMAQVIATPEFAAWVKESPMRVRMYTLADQYDTEAADELLSNFKASGAPKATPSVVPNDAIAKAAATLKAGSVGATSTTAPPAQAKKYRRSDIMRLMSTDPARYEAMADEILAAYAEGRVV